MKIYILTVALIISLLFPSKIFASIEPQDEIIKLFESPQIHFPMNLTNEDWGYDYLQLDELIFGNEPVKIALLDTGVDSDHSYIAPYISKTYDVSGEMDPEDYAGHGTKVAGIITAHLPQTVELLSIKVFTNNNTSSVTKIVNGIELAIEEEADIINMSLGTFSNSASIQEAVEKAQAAGILIVAAAGNFGGTGLTYPARYNDVIAVGSIGKLGERSKFSQVGQGLDFVAPGELVYTSTLNNEMTYDSGTSLSAGYITKMIASYISHGFTAVEIHERLKEIGEHLYANEKVGFGVINANKLLDQLIVPFLHQGDTVKPILDNQKKWTITFSQQVLQTNANLANIFIADDQGKTIPLKRIVEENRVIIYPEKTYMPSVTYTLYVLNTMQSAHRTLLSKQYITTFILKGGV